MLFLELLGSLTIDMRREQSKSPSLTDAEPDRISCLPGHVIDQILSHLSIREAVRTNVLSSKWRYKWATLPNLVFDRNCVSAASQDHSVIKSELCRIIDHVLLLHSGPINKFQLSHRDLIGVTHIDRWTFHLTGRSIKELVLEIWKGQPYKIPWCLFSWQSLRHLELYNCWLKPPSTFEGFKNLKCLDLQRVTMAQDAFENLISGCPLLEYLLLMDLDGFTEFNIHAPNLKQFELMGKFEGISFENTFQLAVVCVGLRLNSESNKSRLHGCSSNLLKFFVHLPHIQSLAIDSYFLKYLAAGVVPVKLPSPCIDLSYLSLHINLSDLKELSAALCVFRSSPNLQELEIFVRPEEQSPILTLPSYFYEDIFLDWPAMRVQHVRIDGISGINSELVFIRFLLLYSPVLLRMTVKPVLNVRSELVKELLQFRRASERAEVFYLDSS